MKHAITVAAHPATKILYMAVVCILWLEPSSAQDDVRTIIQRSVDANRTDWKAAPSYDYFERDQQNGETRTHEVTMILGSPYERLVAINGEPLTSGQQAAEQHKLDEVTTQRRQESAAQRAQRISKYEKDRKRDQLLMNELVKAFDFKLLGQQKLGAYDVDVLKATPRAGYQPPNMEAQVLTGMEGKLWIDRNTFQWVKVEARVIHPVSIEGFVARVEPGTHFELEKVQVSDGIWLPKHFEMKSRAKIFFLFNHSTQADETYFDYHPSPSSGPGSFPGQH
jgi:hypothetical protein